MDYRELARRINERLCAGVKTLADREDCLLLDKEWAKFVQVASEEELRDFKSRSIGLEAFAMIVEGLKYDADKEKYLAEAAQREWVDAL